MADHAFALIQAGPEDEANPDLGAAQVKRGVIPDVSKNWAEDATTVAWVMANVASSVAYAREQRKPLEEEWREVRRLGLMIHDSNQKYIGRSNVYLPTFAHARDVLVSQLTTGLFPSDDFMDVTSLENDDSFDGDASPEGADEDARKVKQYLSYELIKSAKMRSNIKPVLKQYVQYGWGVAKMWYHKELTPLAKGKVRRLKDLHGIPQFEMVKDLKREGVRFQARDIFSVYVWPPTVDSIEEATLVFEDIDLPLSFIRAMGERKAWVEAELALKAGENTNHNFNRQQYQQDNMSDPTIPTQGTPASGELSQWRTLSEVWTMMPLPDEAYVGNEEVGSHVAVRILLSNGDSVVHEIKRQPFWHGRLPYFAPRMTSDPGQFYPKGAGFMGKAMQYLANDIANQINDNLTYGLTPMTLVNPGALAGPLTPIRPGGVWQTTDVNNGIKFDRPPVEQIQYGQQMLSTYLSMQSDNIGVPPILQGTNAGKGARTATSSQILQKNASNPIQDMVEDLEHAIMIPAMEMAHSLGQQYRSEDVMILVDGKTERISPDDLIKDCQYSWLASSQSANSQQRAQQLMMLFQSIMPLMPLFQQQGKTIDPSVILEKVWTDGLGQRSFRKLVIPAPQGQGGPGTPGGAPGMPPGPEAGPGPQDMQTQNPDQNQDNPSGNEDFADVRDHADAISAMAGAVK